MPAVAHKCSHRPWAPKGVTERRESHDLVRHYYSNSSTDLAENGVDESTSGKEKRKVPTRSMRATVRHREGAEGGHANQGLPKRPVQKRRQKALPRVEGRCVSLTV